MSRETTAYFVPTWFTQEVMPEASGSQLKVMHSMCMHRQADGRVYITQDSLARELNLSVSAVSEAIHWALTHPRNLLVRHVTNVYTPFPAPASTSERTIQLAILSEIRSSIVCACPNYTPSHWWECDLWAVTKAGYAVEYEIKISVQDFKADAAKGKVPWNDNYVGALPRTTKHTELAAFNPRGPSRFFYVIPTELEEAIKPILPAWAGLGLFDGGRGVVFVKSAPSLHRVKVKPREIRLAQTRMWHRYWDAISQLERLRQKGAL